MIDGDTFVSGGRHIRLWGIDAPEKGEDFYLAAKLYLEVVLNEMPHSCYYKDTDRYDRLVMQCFSDGEDVAGMMVRGGVAKDYPQYSKGFYAPDEQFTQENGYGIWGKK